MNIFKYLDYRKYLKDFVEQRKKVNSKFTFSLLSDVMNIQKTYLSQVLSGRAELNTDQIFLLTEYLQLKESESEYLNLLIEHSRTSLPKRKKLLLQKIKLRQQRELTPDKLIPAKFIEPKEKLDQTDYFLNPYNSIVHVYLSLPAFKKDPFSLSKELGLAKDDLNRIFVLLNDLKIIRYTPKAAIPIEILESSIHSTSSHLLTNTQQILFRSMALDKLMKIPREKRHASHATFSATFEVYIAMKNEYMEFMSRCHKLVQNCEPNEVYHMNFDLFPLKEES